ncbi:hypothetical protein D9M72_603740 [compost metagenome]
MFVPSGLCIALVAFSLSLINYAVDEVTNPRLRKIRLRKIRVTKIRKAKPARRPAQSGKRASA